MIYVLPVNASVNEKSYNRCLTVHKLNFTKYFDFINVAYIVVGIEFLTYFVSSSVSGVP